MTSVRGKICCTAETLRRWWCAEASPKRPWLAGAAAQIARVHAASLGLYGSRKVWHQLPREGTKVGVTTG